MQIESFLSWSCEGFYFMLFANLMSMRQLLGCDHEAGKVPLLWSKYWLKRWSLQWLINNNAKNLPKSQHPVLTFDLNCKHSHKMLASRFARSTAALSTPCKVIRSFSSTSSPRDFARVQIVGRLGIEPEHVETKNGQHVMNYAIAVNSYKKGIDGAEPERTTSWYNISSYQENDKARLENVPKGWVWTWSVHLQRHIINALNCIVERGKHHTRFEYTLFEITTSTFALTEFPSQITGNGRRRLQDQNIRRQKRQQDSATQSDT